MRLDLAHIQRWITPGSRVLDLGCGDGEFLQMLQEQRQVNGIGLEIDAQNINLAIGRGLNIIEQDMDKSLANFRNQSFDTVIMAHALQVLHHPDRVLDEMLRIGRECVVTFPNRAEGELALAAEEEEEPETADEAGEEQAPAAPAAEVGAPRRAPAMVSGRSTGTTVGASGSSVRTTLRSRWAAKRASIRSCLKSWSAR